MAGLEMGERTPGAEIIATTIHPSAQRIQVMEEAVTATATRGMTAVRVSVDNKRLPLVFIFKYFSSYPH